MPSDFRALISVALVTVTSFVVVPRAHAQPQPSGWLTLFARSAPSAAVPPASLANPCFGRGLQPDSVALTIAPIGQIETWTGTAWRSAAQQGDAAWVRDTVVAALHSVDCLLGSGAPRVAIVERDQRYLRLTVLALPGDPPDVIRSRARDGTLSVLQPITVGENNALVSLLAYREALTQQREDAARDQRRMKALHRSELLARGWSNATVNDVIDKNVAIGMTAAMVREAWGEPDEINVTTTAYARMEQWCYGLRDYVYFRNGRVDGIQTSR